MLSDINSDDLGPYVVYTFDASSDILEAADELGVLAAVFNVRVSLGERLLKKVRSIKYETEN